MPKSRIAIVSSPTLELWDWRNPLSKGIGGSETSHIELAARLARLGHEVISYAPIAPDTPPVGPEGVVWKDSRGLDLQTLKGFWTVFNYRDPTLFEVRKPRWHTWNFVAQDCDYKSAWTPQRLAKVDRYITLCERHSELTSMLHPEVRPRIFQSTNGVRKDYLNALTDLPKRVPYRCLYASSPDRGLKLLLEQWWRIRERFPLATLHVAYGFENMDVIIAAMGGDSWHVGYKAEVEKLLTQPGVKWLGRLPQDKLYQEYFAAQVYAAPSSWPETSGIAFLDAMACGCVPVTTDYWAQGENVGAGGFGYLVDGLPDKSELVRSHWLKLLYTALESTASGDWDDEWRESGELEAYRSRRQAMMTWARERFDWDAVARQWAGWLGPVPPLEPAK